MDEATRAAFARMDRYFELSQLQFGELRSEFGELRSEFGELRSEFGELRSEVRANSEGLQAMRSELRGFRDWAETSFAHIRSELKELRSWAEAQFADVRTELQLLGGRIDRLEQQAERNH